MREKFPSKEQSSRSSPNAMTIIDNIDFSYKLHDGRNDKRGEDASVHHGVQATIMSYLTGCSNTLCNGSKIGHQ